MTNPICINVDHSIKGFVLIKKEDWELVLKVLKENNPVYEFDTKEGNC